MSAAVYTCHDHCGLGSGTHPSQGCVDPKANLSSEETRMFGRILAADEDLGGGYYSEARGKFEKIVSNVREG